VILFAVTCYKNKSQRDVKEVYYFIYDVTCGKYRWLSCTVVVINCHCFIIDVYMLYGYRIFNNPSASITTT